MEFPVASPAYPACLRAERIVHIDTVLVIVVVQRSVANSASVLVAHDLPPHHHAYNPKADEDEKHGNQGGNDARLD